MTWRRLRLLCLIFLLTGALAFWLYLHRDQVTQANFDRIAEDMTLDEVQALLKRKPDHISIDKRIGPPVFGRPSSIREFQRHQWDASELTIVVVIDESQRVVDRYRVDAQVQPWFARLLQAAKRSFALQ